jgi:hypothetical protein
MLLVNPRTVHQSSFIQMHSDNIFFALEMKEA